MSRLKYVAGITVLILQSHCKPIIAQNHSLTQLTFNDSTLDRLPNWSPDGNYILYSTGTPSDSRVMRIPSPGGNPEQVAPMVARHARWSPEGDYIAFEGNSGVSLMMIPASGGPPLRFDPDTLSVSGGGMPCWSPDGRRIAFRSSGSVYIMDLETRSLHLLFGMEGRLASPGDWSPDGRKILIEMTGNSDPSHSDIWEIPLNGLPKQVTFLEGKQEDPAYSPDGSMILFTSGHEGEQAIWIMQSRGGDPELFAPEGYEGCWSPDGSSIVFVSDRTGHPSIWRMDLDQGFVRERFNPPVYYTEILPTIDTGTIPVFPFVLERAPESPSPGLSWDYRELVQVRLADDRFAWVDATVENGDTMNYRAGLYGKGGQVMTDGVDFPSLSLRGLHSGTGLLDTRTITGISVSRITVDGRPGAASEAGFMAADETIISVLMGDNRMVSKLGLRHPDLARPLFHVWNIYRFGEAYNEHANPDEMFECQGIIYNGRKIGVKVAGSRGWQESIFHDEILGTYRLEAWRELERNELEFLENHYGNLPEDDFNRLKKRISSIQTGEMVPYYINRYGFYEGHTEYRAEPLAIAFIFGLRSLEEIHRATGGDLYGYLNLHFTQNSQDQ